MKINKYKFLSTPIFCLIVALWSESLCMEREPINHEMQPISKTEVKEYPHSAVLSLECWFKNGEAERHKTGTGFLIGENFALTAAHVVQSAGQMAHKIGCHINRHGSSLFGSPICSKTVEVKGYVYASQYDDAPQYADIDSGIDYDYALLYLGEEEDIRQHGLINPVHYYTELDNKLMFCGYPGKGYNVYSNKDHNGSPFPYKVEGALLKQTDKMMTFNTRVFGGMSGGPVMYAANDNEAAWNAIAIVCATDECNVFPGPVEDAEREKGKLYISKIPHTNKLQYFIKSNDGLINENLNIDINEELTTEVLSARKYEILKEIVSAIKPNILQEISGFPPKTYACFLAQEKIKGINQWKSYMLEFAKLNEVNDELFRYVEIFKQHSGNLYFKKESSTVPDIVSSLHCLLS